MARWTDLATWRGPTPNCGDGDQYQNEGEDRMREQRGLVIHIAEGYFEGTISYQKNPDANVSSHFVLSNGAKGQGYDGELAQLVDTDITAWTQRAGNGHWLSVECAGFTPNPLTAAQCESVAQLLARTHREYGVPLQLAVNPDGRGLGHHSMGCNWPSGAWGHCDCPGSAIIAQKPAILARAIAIVNGGDTVSKAEVIDALDDAVPYTSSGVAKWAAEHGWGNVSSRALLEYTLRVTQEQIPQLVEGVAAAKDGVVALNAKVGAISAVDPAAVAAALAENPSFVAALAAAVVEGVADREAAADRARADVLDGP